MAAQSTYTMQYPTNNGSQGLRGREMRTGGQGDKLELTLKLKLRTMRSPSHDQAIPGRWLTVAVQAPILAPRYRSTLL